MILNQNKKTFEYEVKGKALYVYIPSLSRMCSLNFSFIFYAVARHPVQSLVVSPHRNLKATHFFMINVMDNLIFIFKIFNILKKHKN